MLADRLTKAQTTVDFYMEARIVITPYERVKLSRQRTAATFPLPTPLDCIRYAITELAEYDDALLRQERAGDKRNNDKAHDPRSELGQAIYMLLSAAVQSKHKPKLYEISQQSRLQLYTSSLEWLTTMARHLAITRGGLEVVTDGTYNALCCLAAVHGWPVDSLIDETCAAFEAKHAPAREAHP